MARILPEFQRTLLVILIATACDSNYALLGQAGEALEADDVVNIREASPNLTAMKRRPHLVFVLGDDVGFGDVGYADHAIISPTIRTSAIRSSPRPGILYY